MNQIKNSAEIPANSSWLDRHVVKGLKVYEDGHPVPSSEDIQTAEDVTLAQEFGWEPQFAREVMLAVRDIYKEEGRVESSSIEAAMFKRALRLVRRGTSHRARCDMMDYMCLAFRWFDELGGIDNPTDLARKLRVSKANATKYVNFMRDVLPPGLQTMPAMPGQRSEAARLKFAQKCHERQREKAEKLKR